MNIKNLLLEHAFASFSILADTIWAFCENVGKKITWKNLIFLTIISWLVIFFSPFLYGIVISILKILNNLPLLIDHKDFNLLVSVAFLSIGILLSFIREYTYYLIRLNLYLVLMFIMFSKLATY